MRGLAFAAVLALWGCAPPAPSMWAGAYEQAAHDCATTGNAVACNGLPGLRVEAEEESWRNTPPRVNWGVVTAAGLILMAPRPVFVGPPRWSPEPPGVAGCWRHGC